MNQIILNERKWCEDILEEQKLGRNGYEKLSKLAKYYRASGYSNDEIFRKLTEFVLRCDPRAVMCKWNGYIDTAVKYSKKASLIEIDGINISRDDIEWVERESARNKRKLLFTMLCIAKYFNTINDKNNNWVNTKSKDLFAHAGIVVSVKRQNEMLHDLWKAGFIEFSLKVDNTNIRLTKDVSNDVEPIAVIDDMTNIGNWYLMICGERYVQCCDCNAVVKRLSNSQKRCSKCAAIYDRDYNATYYRNKLRLEAKES